MWLLAVNADSHWCLEFLPTVSKQWKAPAAHVVVAVLHGAVDTHFHALARILRPECHAFAQCVLVCGERAFLVSLIPGPLRGLCGEVAVESHAQFDKPILRVVEAPGFHRLHLRTACRRHRGRLLAHQRHQPRAKRRHDSHAECIDEGAVIEVKDLRHPETASGG